MWSWKFKRKILFNVKILGNEKISLLFLFIMNKLKEFDFNLLKKYKDILGIDEVGRGCIAGPLVVAGVILNNDFYSDEINDSKTIKKIEKRKELADLIKQNCKYFEILVFDSNFVDLHNPKQTSKIGMNQIAKKLENKFDICLTDFEKIDESINQINLTKGDQTSFSIACASILAKSKRDEIISEIHKKYPEYEFLKHQGYLTKKHKEIILKHKPIKNLYRLSYKFIKDFKK